MTKILFVLFLLYSMVYSNRKLTNKELKKLKKDGFVLCKNLINNDDLDFLIQEGKNTINRKTSFEAKSYTKIEFDTLQENLKLQNITRNLPANQIMENNKFSRFFGGKTRVFKDAFLSFSPGLSGCGFHVDDPYFWPSPLRNLGHQGINIWIALSEYKKEYGGGLAVVRNSEKSNYFYRARKLIRRKNNNIPNTCKLSTLDPIANSAFSEEGSDLLIFNGFKTSENETTPDNPVFFDEKITVLLKENEWNNTNPFFNGSAYYTNNNSNNFIYYSKNSTFGNQFNNIEIVCVNLKEVSKEESETFNLNENREPETKYLMNYYNNNKIHLSLTIHSGALVVNYPFDGPIDKKYSKTKDDDFFRYISLEYVKNNPFLQNSPFKNGITNGSEWYALFGGLQDWRYVYNNGYEITLELSNEKIVEENKIYNYWQNNKKSFIRMIEIANTGIKIVNNDKKINIKNKDNKYE